MIYPEKETSALIELALEEDIGGGDITSELLVPDTLSLSAKIIAKEEGVLCGVPAIAQVYNMLSEEVVVDAELSDGHRLRMRDSIAVVRGSARTILTGERLVLNILCHLSGIATMTSRFVRRLDGTNCKILDTRKTSPGMRMLEKYAVAVGGGENHRIGLWDMILIKNNHISAAGGIEAVLDKTFADGKPKLPVEVEVKNLDELKIALGYPLDRIMLDNFDCITIREAIELRRNFNKNIPFEASGGITLDNCRQYAETGVEFISSGELTHSVEALDISMTALEDR